MRKQGLLVWAFHLVVMEVFERLQEKFEIKKVFSHEETGVELTFKRDLAIGTSKIKVMTYQNL